MSKRTNPLLPALQAGMTRREVWPSIGCGVLLAGNSMCARTAEPSPVAETAYGRVRGVSLRGVHIFRGIPYGGPAEGGRRFLPPAKPAKWAGVRDAKVTGPRCVQGPGNILLSPLIGEYFGGGRPDRVEISRQDDSENCLVLNVLTPGLRGKRPVMFYIHGGGLSGGSSVLTLLGDGLVREQDVVLVGVNHRLNVFGYTYLGGLSSKYAAGNAGQLDLVAALQWVRENIARFGGDPANVMIFGESGGGAKVSALMAMPATKGLFHRASVQSGSALRVGTAEAGTELARKLLANLGLHESQVDELPKIPADKLFAAARAAGLGGTMVVDGHSIPQQTWDPTAPEVSATVPLLVGNDKDESTLFSLKNEALFSLDDAGLRASLVKAGTAEGDLDSLLALYRRDHPADSPTDLYFRISTDRGARRNAIRQAERKAEQGRANVYMWYCQWNTPLGQGKFKIKSFHTCDLPLTMRLVRFPESEQLSRQLAGAWAAFARTGNPSQKGLAWPAYTLAERATMIFDGPKSEVVNDPDRDERRMVRDRPSAGPL
ncbi:MAG TPA: carboxylesterase family protein [Bryobacteraceae bacterium]|nr:carboxylesterase family protein [Bryobacteraceae bacterium]